MAGKRGIPAWTWLLLAVVVLVAWQLGGGKVSRPDALPAPQAQAASLPAPASPATSPAVNARRPDFLPQQAHDTIALVQRGGPFPYRQDGGVFGNREGHLPRKPRGWYHEYTVETPGLSHRGARRIVTGGNPPQAWYYSDDHYDSFRGFDPGTAGGNLP